MLEMRTGAMAVPKASMADFLKMASKEATDSRAVSPHMRFLCHSLLDYSFFFKKKKKKK